MKNVKCENDRQYSKYNVKMQITAEFASNLTEDACLMLAI